ncbi:MAG: DUF3592 domain-containing protein [Akkermansiaceae bacterium]
MSLLTEIIRDSGVKKSTFNSTLFALFFAAIFGFGGILIFTTEFLTPFLESRQANDWIQIEAHVTKSKLKNNDGALNINLKYNYQYQGKQYQGNRFELTKAGRNFSTKTYRKTAKSYPKGSKIPIWVNPHNPEQSVYKRNMVITNWIALPFSIPFLTVGTLALLYALLNPLAFKIQKQAWLEAAVIASRNSAPELHKALSDENLNSHQHTKINFLKRHHSLTSLTYLFLILFANGIISVFVIVAIGMHIEGNPLAYILTIFLIPFVIFGFTFIRKFLNSLFHKIGDDYVILSTWNYKLTLVTHHWLLLTNHRTADEFQIFTTATKNARELKKILKTTPIQDTYKAPEKSVITGTTTHAITGSSEKEIHLLITTKTQTSKKNNTYQLPLQLPDNS